MNWLGRNVVAEAVSGVSARMADLDTSLFVQAALRAMALSLKLKPSMRGQLSGVHPLGVPWTFEASFLFSTWDGGVNVHAIFRNGEMSVGVGPIDRPDTTVRFKGAEQMRGFFTGATDPLTMMLTNDMAAEGNLTFLSKFGHIARVVRFGGKKDTASNGDGQCVGPVRWQDVKGGGPGEPCAEPPEGEVTFLADPYLAEYTLDDFPVIKKLLWVHRSVMPEICPERPRLVTEAVLKDRINGNGGGHEAVFQQGRVFHHLMTHKQAIVRGDDRIAGTTTSRPIGVAVYPELHGTTIWSELLSVEGRELNPCRITDETVRILDQEVFPFWGADNLREYTRKLHGNPDFMRMEERFVLYFLWKNVAISHTIADGPMVLERGLKDIRAEAERREEELSKAEGDDEHSPTELKKKRDFYRALQLVCDAMMDYAWRLSVRAREMASELGGNGEADEEKRRNLLEIARACEKVPAHPAETLREALQCIWLTLLGMQMESTNVGISLGRLDMWLQPYFERHMEGAETEEEKEARINEAVELTCAFMLKATDHLPLVPEIGNRLFGGSSSNQVITLGGVTPDGTSAVCDMTWIFLKATEMLRLRDPNMNARFAPGVNSEQYLRRLAEVNILTRATPSIHNDDAMVPSLVNQGFTLEDARDWGATGCVEPTICGRHLGHTNCMMFNMLAPMEMVLRDGTHPLLGEQVGPHTGDPRTFDTYERFLEAYKEQLGGLIDRTVEGNNTLGESHQALKPTPFLSAVMQGPMESGKDVVHGGAVHNSSGVAMIGLSDVVDSLAAVKTLVYERKRVDFDTLLKALDADFEGHEPLLAEILNKVPKFGKDDDLPKSIAEDIMDFIYDRHQSHRNYRGGKYFTGYWSMSNHVAFGILSGALPSGRRRGKPFTPGLTPSPLSGAALTEQISTVAGLDRNRTPNNIAFNVKVVPGANDTHKAVLDRMTAYLKAYMELGGMQVQFNTVSSQTLRDAMENPSEYRDLLVRISGYNAYFVELNRDMQLELIERTEHNLG